MSANVNPPTLVGGGLVNLVKPEQGAKVKIGVNEAKKDIVGTVRMEYFRNEFIRYHDTYREADRPVRCDYLGYLNRIAESGDDRG